MSRNSIDIRITGALMDGEGVTHVIDETTEAETIFCVSFRDVPNSSDVEISTKILGGFCRCHMTAILAAFAKSFGIEALTDSLDDLCGFLERQEGEKSDAE